jgi:hypothetical protein
MPEQPPAGSPAPSDVQARLRDLAQRLRATEHLDPETQQELADLLEEMSQTVATHAAPSPELTHLADSTAHLAQALHQEQDAGLLARARERLEEAVVRAETGAPVAAGLARRLIDALSNLGI